MQVGSKFVFVQCLSVCPSVSHEITTFWDLVNPYLVPESAFWLVVGSSWLKGSE